MLRSVDGAIAQVNMDDWEAILIKSFHKHSSNMLTTVRLVPLFL